MQPDNNNAKRPYLPSASQPAAINGAQQSQRDTAANIVRSQIDTIYQHDQNATMPAPREGTLTHKADEHPQPLSQQQATTHHTAPNSSVKAGPGAVNMQAYNQQAQVANPYERTHDASRHELQEDAWRKYHSAWQSYYQQYYERYYVGEVHAAKKSLEEHAAPSQESPQHTSSISSNEAMYDLREKLRRTITDKAQKVRKSRHFIPITAAVCVMLIFVFLQYNRLIFASVDAYVSPGSLDPATLIVDPNAGAPVSDKPVLIVPKISVDVPILFNANAASQDSLNLAMTKGVAWFNIKGASARPGEKGNFVLSGHSSNDWLDQGDYKFIFARLDQLDKGDTIYADYQGVRYVYTVTHKKVVDPTDVSALAVGTDKPRITLITCTPLGTALHRLLVFADQVSPNPDSASAAKDTADTTTAAQMPSNSPTFIERLFGAR